LYVNAGIYYAHTILPLLVFLGNEANIFRRLLAAAAADGDGDVDGDLPHNPSVNIRQSFENSPSISAIWGSCCAVF